MFVSNGKQRLLVGASFDFGKKLGKFLKGGQLESSRVTFFRRILSNKEK